MAEAVPCWGIRHKPTGKWMPVRMFKSGGGRGWSHWTPDDARQGYDGFDKNPRLFFKKVAAQRALNAWLAGAWEARMTGGGDIFDPPEPGSPAPYKPQVERKSEDMEIVEFSLREMSRG